jgi:hypothetical protein
MQRKIAFVLNGRPAEVTVDEDRMLLGVLRRGCRRGARFSVLLPASAGSLAGRGL